MRRGRADVMLGRRLQIGQRWRRRSDGTVAAVRQLHRSDALAELGTDFGRRLVPFADLRTGWDELVAHDATPAVPVLREPTL